MKPPSTRRPEDAGAYLGTRRQFLQRAACCLAAVAGAALAQSVQAAPWASDCRPGLPGAAGELLAQAWQGLDAAALWDSHCHLLGTGDGGSGCYLHPSLTQGFNVIERLRRRAILDAACVGSDETSVDRAYVQRLRQMAAAFPAGARWLLFAFEAAYDDAGQLDRERTTVHVPNRHAAEVAAQAPQHFGWVASIHPYRDDALAELDRAVAAGALAVKWLPSSMNIDLRDRRSLRFAAALAARGLPLIVHCGEEKAVPGARRDDLVNPLHVRAPLQQGARVIVAHCASLGHAADLDRTSAPRVPAFELFARLMGERAFEGLLLGDLSAAFQVNREPEVWRTLLQRDDWAPRLLHGSDYPLPGLKPLVSLGRLQAAGLLQEAQVAPLAELREHNALAFDLALKRSLRLGEARLHDAIFATRRHFAAPGAGAASPRKEEAGGDTSGGRR